MKSSFIHCVLVLSVCLNRRVIPFVFSIVFSNFESLLYFLRCVLGLRFLLHDLFLCDQCSFCRRMILASGMEGMEGFRQRWSFHGRLEDTKYLLLPELCL